MKCFYTLTTCLIVALTNLGFAQDIEDDAGMFDETTSLEEADGLSIILDNTRTKQGRDFYELFYRSYSTAPVQADSVQNQLNQTLGKTATVEDEFTITIEELPSNNGFSTIVNITINDILVWQQFIQSRLDVLEYLSANASETVRAYVADFQNVMNQLGSEDQAGSGVF